MTGRASFIGWKVTEFLLALWNGSLLQSLSWNMTYFTGLADGHIVIGVDNLRVGAGRSRRQPEEEHNTYLAAQYHRIAARRGKKRATVAVAHSILVIAYYVLSRREPYRELGGNYFDERKRESVANRLIHRLEKLGYQVSGEGVLGADLGLNGLRPRAHWSRLEVRRRRLEAVKAGVEGQSLAGK